MIEGVSCLLLALFFVYVFRFLEHKKSYKGVSWHIFRLVSTLLGITAISILSNTFGYPVEFSNFIHDPKKANSLTGSIAFLSIAASVIGMAFLVEYVFFKDFLMNQPSNVKTDNQ